MISQEQDFTKTKKELKSFKVNLLRSMAIELCVNSRGTKDDLIEILKQQPYQNTSFYQNRTDEDIMKRKSSSRNNSRNNKTANQPPKPTQNQVTLLVDNNEHELFIQLVDYMDRKLSIDMTEKLKSYPYLMLYELLYIVIKNTEPTSVNEEEDIDDDYEKKDYIVCSKKEIEKIKTKNIILTIYGEVKNNSLDKSSVFVDFGLEDNEPFDENLIVVNSNPKILTTQQINETTTFIFNGKYIDSKILDCMFRHIIENRLIRLYKTHTICDYEKIEMKWVEKMKTVRNTKIKDDIDVDIFITKIPYHFYPCYYVLQTIQSNYKNSNTKYFRNIEYL